MIDKESYITQLRELQESDDTESAHVQADRILCDILLQLGYTDIIEEYHQIGKWYA